MSEYHGTVCWTELMTRAPEAAAERYARICGWEIITREMPGGALYRMGMKGGAPVAGILDLTPEAELAEAPCGWLTYFAVDDVDAAAAAMERAGGRLSRPIFDIPQVGRIAMLTDPDGAALGMMTPSAPAPAA